MAFRINRGFVPGYNLVEILQAEVGKLVGYDALAIRCRNEFDMENTFYIFLNDLYLLNQLMALTFVSYTYDEIIDEHDFEGLVLYLYLEPKDKYMKITKFKEYVADETSV